MLKNVLGQDFFNELDQKQDALFIDLNVSTFQQR